MNNLCHPAAALLLGFLPGIAAACTCIQPKPYPDRRLEYHSVFHGKVIATEWDEARALIGIRFDVIEDYSMKASGDDTLTVWTTGNSGICGVSYPVGAEVLVFADTGNYSQSKPGELRSGLCSGNASGSGLEQALKELEEAPGVVPGRSQSGIRRKRAKVDCGQNLFEGNVQANGVLRIAPGIR